MDGAQAVIGLVAARATDAPQPMAATQLVAHANNSTTRMSRQDAPAIAAETDR